tara:strand:+ start:912 stop:1643 length:732 start_codon:yes stop_codon:yes gene_type:complete
MRIRPLDNTRASSATSETKRTAGTAATGTGSISAPRDAASIMGVPENELTPNVQRALLTLMGEVDQLRQETERLRSKVMELESLADRDVLLPILNRRAFVREVSKAVALAERHNAPSALVYLDLNGFKAINDDFGHAAGDAALQHVGSMLTAHLRETDAIGRLGGDEFGIVLTLSSLPAAEQKAEELVNLIAETPFEHDGRELTIHAAWGVQPLAAGMTPDLAMAEADAAMYARKQSTKRAAG